MLLSALAILLFGASIALLVRAVVLPRTRIVEQVRGIEGYGFAATARPAASDSNQQSGLADVAGRLGDLLAERLKGFQPESLRREIMSAGLYRLTPRVLLGYRILGLLGFGLLGLVVASDAAPGLGLLLVVVCGGIGWLAPLTFVRRRARFRLDAIDRALPDLIDLLVVTVQAGLGLGASLQLASTKTQGPLRDELSLLVQEQRMGRSLREGLEGMLARADTPAMRSFVRSVVQGETLGVSIGAIMRNLAVEMRTRRRQQVEERANKTPIKILFPLVFLIFPAMFIVLLGPTFYNLAESISGQ